ncbi:hypothetical protein Dimus_032421 [Dionaea muscipula]
MGNQQSKAELVYQQVIERNVEAIKSLRSDGAGLEWMDKEGKTPLIVACMDSGHYLVAKTLIELGANVNAYRPGRHAGTPLHHASKRGLDQMVRLLLSHGANPFLTNDDCQTPLDVARAKGFSNVVRMIEGHICTFSGHIREILAPSFLGALAPQLLSRKVWAVVIPCGPQNPSRPSKLELVIYQTMQDAQPRTIIALWKSKIEEPKFHYSDPVLIIHSEKHRYKFGSAIEDDKQQFLQLYNACKGTPRRAMISESENVGASPQLPGTSASAAAFEPSGSGHSSQSGMPSNTNGWGTGSTDPAPQPSAASASGWLAEPTRPEYNGWDIADPKAAAASSQPSAASASGWLAEPTRPEYNGWDIADPKAAAASSQPGSVSLDPSAPPLPESDGAIHYPTIDLSPVEFSSMPESDNITHETGSSCVICWEAPVEGACIPCGHMVGCMSCLKEIKAKNGVCPVCRSKIDQVVRLYAV